MERTDKRPGRLRRPPLWPRPRDGAKLIPIGLAIGGMLFLALSVAAGVIAVLFAIGQFRGFKKEPLTAASLYDLLKIGFAFAAGIGGVVALVTAYRRQRVAEFAQELADRAQELADRAEDREAARLFNERFGDAAGQLGHDNAAVRLAGVYAMARLADDWPAQRQTCVDVLCAYLRMPYQPDPGPDAPPDGQQAFRSLREVRHTVIRVITAHLQPDDSRTPTAQDWRGLSLDFTGTVFDGGSFNGARFAGGTVSFDHARFAGGEVSFARARFAGGTVSFIGAQFAGGTVTFYNAEFTGGEVSFIRARFTGGTVSFDHARFAGGDVSFARARFAGGAVSFDYAHFVVSAVSVPGMVSFVGAEFTGGEVSVPGMVHFDGAEFTGGEVHFYGAWFADGEVHFDGARFAGGEVHFDHADFAGGAVRFDGARFAGGTVSFGGARFAGGAVSFSRVREWAVPPHGIDWRNPPPGVVPYANAAASDTGTSEP
jgi:uncharacterized protein YjbI with pentapeptide repeats